MRRFVTVGVSLLAMSGQALAACPIELAIYADRDGVAELNFSPVEGAAVTNRFKLLMQGGRVVDGHVLWIEDPERPLGLLMFDCPEGDVTGDEIAACTVWEGVIYAVDGKGSVRLMPGEGKDAPQTLVLPALGPAIRHAPAFAPNGPSKLPGDVFTLAGCQE